MSTRTMFATLTAAVFAAVLVLAPPAGAATYQWANEDGDGNPTGGDWTTADWELWDGSAWVPTTAYPDAQADVAEFPDVISPVTVDSDVTVGTINNDGGKFNTLDGSGKVTFDNGGSGAEIDLGSQYGTMTLSAPMQLNSDLEIGGGKDNFHTLNSTISGDGKLTFWMPNSRGNTTSQPQYAWTMGGTDANTYSGGTVLNMGISIGGYPTGRYAQLILAKDGATGTGDVVADTTTPNKGSLRIQGSGDVDRIDDSAALKLVEIPYTDPTYGSPISTLYLDGTDEEDRVNETVGSLHFWEEVDDGEGGLVWDWVQQDPGTYGAEGSGADYEMYDWFGKTTASGSEIQGGTGILTVVPEPTSVLLLLSGLLGLALYRRRR